MGYSVGEIARIAGVTVRTLHHYDEIGLLRASERSRSGYRMYTDDDVERLQRILFYRELELPLDQIASLIRDPSIDPVNHLRRQRTELVGKIERLQAVVSIIDKTMEATEMNIKLTPEERLEVFGDFLPEEYEDEAKDRWGESQEWKQSARRTANYTKADWLTIKAEAAANEQQFAAAYQGGIAADAPEAMAAAETHRQHITTWFYDCSYEVHRGLGQMYVADERFAKHYDDIAPGLSAYVHDAIVANANR